jgi:hypothetical protein
MTIKPTLPQTRPITYFIAAALAGTITTGLFAGVTALLQRNGMPFEAQLAAERACGDRTYISERDTCVRQWLAAREPSARRAHESVAPSM